MQYRIKEFTDNGIEVRWLDKIRANNAYNFALKYNDETKYGLNNNTVKNIERIKIENRLSANAWILHRMSPIGSLQIVYGKNETCVIESNIFIAKWYDIFSPSRDDAIIIHNNNETILFYCHEDVFEFGIRIS